MDKMSELLILKETIYKEEVDMLMAGKSVKAIVSAMDKKAEELKEKEEKGRKDNEYNRKINELENKLKTAEMLLKAGVISQEEYDKLLQSKNAVEAEYKIIYQQNAEKAEKNAEKTENLVKSVKKTTRKKVVKDDKKEKAEPEGTALNKNDSEMSVAEIEKENKKDNPENK